MKKVTTMGEALIDFVPTEQGCQLKDVPAFVRVAGGAPANVAACVAKLGGTSRFLSKLGQDAFGDHIVEVLAGAGVDTSLVSRTNQGATGLAFVSTGEQGERDFAFYRHNSADLLWSEDQVQREWFVQGDILHFGSVNLVESPAKYAHYRAMDYALEAGGIVSFDPNVRLALWGDEEACRRTIEACIPKCHILKISDEELPFITGIEDEEEAIQKLFVGNIKMVLYTKGAEGSYLCTKGQRIYVPSYQVTPVDTTGAGDSFIGAFLYQLSQTEVTPSTLDLLSEEVYERMLQFANGCAAYMVTKKGVIPHLPTKEEVESFLVNP